MKPSELMDGDWAIINEDHPDCPFTRQVDIGDLSFFTKFEPIPLTEEMLKANGFDIVQDGDLLTIWKQKDDEYGNEVYDITMYASKGVTFYDTGIRYHGSIRKNIKFVHELQHSLRLCGLGELADNFKIE